MNIWKVILALAITIQASAELRVWTDQSGKTIEAEHVRTLTDQVVLRQADGTEIRVSLETLSERDRRYAIVLTPPRLDINVSRRKDSTNKSGPNNYGPGRQMTEEVISLTATLRKSSSAPYEAPLLAELYLLGTASQSERYVVLEKTTERLRYAEDNSHTFSSGEVNLRQFEGQDKHGVNYEGYLLAVFDKAGDVISLKCSKLAFEKNADAILDAQRGTVFDEDFEVVDQKGREKKPASKENKKPKKRFYRGF